MKVIQDSKALRTALSHFRKGDNGIGFVPTMGFLHEGHLSIVRQAKKENKTVETIQTIGQIALFVSIIAEVVVTVLGDEN